MTATRDGAMRDPRVRLGVAVGAALVVFAVVLAVLSRVAPAPSGPASSSYATAPAGLAAYASVLVRAGVPVRRLRTPVAERAPRVDETLVVLEPDVVEPDEARAIGAWVRRGGRLVTGGGGDLSWLEQVTADVPGGRADGGARRRPLLRTTETEGVREVRSSGGGWEDFGDAQPVIGPAAAPLLVTVSSGAGTVALLADASPLSNARLAQADDAAFGVALAAGRPVAFLETVHGYGAARGFAGLPERVRWTLIGLALTALVALWTVGRRFGPPEDPEREPDPPRTAYVEALATTLARTRDAPGRVAPPPVSASARDRSASPPVSASARDRSTSPPVSASASASDRPASPRRERSGFPPDDEENGS